jgi:RHS repeat-associated protein
VNDRINGVATGTETFTYDALDRVTRITQSGNGVTEKRVDMTYDAASQLTGLNRYSNLAGTQNVANTRYTYDAAGRLTSLSHQRGTNTLAGYSYTYDAANRLTQLVTPDGTSNYSYNNRDELTGTDHSYQTDETYTYDATGNRTGHTIGDHNRILDDGTYTYQYDNEGNRTRRVDKTTGQITQYTWDHRNRLTEVVTQNSAGTVLKDVDYTYDVYDRRIAKSIDADGAGAQSATKEHMVYDLEHIALVFDEAGNETHRYLHGPQIDQILAAETNDQTQWALSDHQGSIRDVITNDGTVLNHITYDSYGNVTSETNPTFDFRFGYTGRERDEETGMHYYRARYFDPAIGTFISEDPLGFAAGDANIYRYVFNSPTNFTDPTGQNAFNDFLANPHVYDTLNRADQFVAGFGSAATFGATDSLRSTIYGEQATRNHGGGWYTAGSMAGDMAMGVVLSGGNAPRWFRRAYNAYNAASDVYAIGSAA